MTLRARLWSWFSPMTRKAMRDMQASWSQAAAVAFVMAAGVTFFIVMNGIYHSLDVSRVAYYEANRFPEGWVQVKRAPRGVVEKVQNIKGIKDAEGRIVAPGLLDMPGMAEPVKARLVSLPGWVEARYSTVHLTEGRMIEPGRADEIVLLADFAKAHKLKPGMRIGATLYGVKRQLLIVGIGLSPEFIYAIPQGEIAPNPKAFAVIWMDYKALSNVFDLENAVNEVQFTFEPNANTREVLDRIDGLLERYGASGAFSRDDHLSDSFIRSQFQQIQMVGFIIPPIFLAVAAFVLNIVITRMVEQDRSQIGLLKAFGYDRFTIGLNYAKGPAIIVAAGLILGFIGGNYMGRGLAGIYTNFYSFPVFIFTAGWQTYVAAALLAILSGGLGVIFAVRKTLKLAPAVAMSPAPPTSYGRGAPFQNYKGRLLDQGSRIIFRHIWRWPGRALFTATGIALGISLLISAQGIRDSLGRIVEVQYDINNRSHVSVSFTEPQGPTALRELTRLPGVLKVEPVRYVNATLIHGSRRANQAITGIEAGATLDRLVDTQEKTISPPLSGIVLADYLAGELGVKPGDYVTIKVREGRHATVDVKVERIVTAFLGTPAHMDISYLNRILMDGPRYSGVSLLVDEKEADALYSKLKGMPKVAGVTIKERTKNQMNLILDQFLGTIIHVNTGFAIMIAIGVVYSSARVSFSEREREIASLRVLGFTQKEVNYVLLGELGLLTLLSLPLGALMGYGLNAFLAGNLDSKIFRVPVATGKETFGFAIFVILAAAVISGIAVMRRVKTLDLVTALRSRE